MRCEFVSNSRTCDSKQTRKAGTSAVHHADAVNTGTGAGPVFRLDPCMADMSIMNIYAELFIVSMYICHLDTSKLQFTDA